MKPSELIELEKAIDMLEHIIFIFFPEQTFEWETLEKLVSAHKTLRGIDITALRQIRLPE